MGEPMRCLKSDRLTGYYDTLKIKKESGEELDWTKITKGELYYLNVIEGVTDAEIGKYYGVSMETVRKKRSKLGNSYKRNKYDAENNNLVQDIEVAIKDEFWKRPGNIRKKGNLEILKRILAAIHPEFPERA